MSHIARTQKVGVSCAGPGNCQEQGKQVEQPQSREGGGQPQSPTYLQRLCVQFLPL